VAKKTAGEFFQAVEDVLTGKVPTRPASSAGVAAVPGVFLAPAATGAAAGSEFVKGAVFGAGVALAGVLVGSLVTRRRG
jgi:hypothetical protein